MPLLELSDGISLHWEARGEGPLVLLLPPVFSTPDVYEGVLSDLERDHRVVVYDARGTGGSTRCGPYDLDTDAGDLIGLLEEVGPPATLLASGETLHRAVRAAARRPELVRAIVNPGATPVSHMRGFAASRGLAGSQTVVEAFFQFISTDYRAGLRSAIGSANPQLGEEALKARVERMLDYIPREATLGRLRGWIDGDSGEQARTLGDRLWMLSHDENDWFPADMVEIMRTETPDARFLTIEDGPLSDPATTAAIVRRAEAEAGVPARGC